MALTKNPIRRVAVGAIALALAGLGADSPTQTIDAGGLTFQVPASWKASRPSNTMRRAQLKVDPAEGDKEPAELVVFAFPGGGGTAEANIQRWRSQFKDDEGNPPKIESKAVKTKNGEATRVETAGRYVAPVFPGSREVQNKPNFRLLGAIVQTTGAENTGYYLKMIGPEKTMVAARPAFDEMIASIKVDAGK